MRDKSTGKSKGYGFVSFKDEATAKEAMIAMRDSEFGDRTVRGPQRGFFCLGCLARGATPMFSADAPGAFLIRCVRCFSRCR